MEFLSGNDWEKYLSNITEKRRTKKLFKLVDEAYSKYNDEIFPEKENLFKAFEKTSFEDTKVVIVGQDPYPNKKATGLAFSIPKGTIETNDSMTQILAELKRETGIERKNRNIESWSDQGVLLLKAKIKK
ncbi:hypothetical protein [Liquorilactobacillus satsumensis]|uniref:hypothetical protein n=1 Tax=Liquorilactobacillus satsumensis TaxID=259059 RepID=UPI0039ECE97D